MHTIRTRNVNRAFSDGLWWLKVTGEIEESRNGRVMVSPEPVCTQYSNPCERVLFSDRRDANPFFHLMEFIWMMSGSDSLAWIEKYNSNMRNFSDDGITLNGSYGYRWRIHFGDEPIDQIEVAVEMLRKDPTSRRVVVGMWDPDVDLYSPSKDIPCNTQLYFRVRGNRLETTVTCRSNDIVWGAYGANAVHFSMLHELVALGAGLIPGTMYQISNNYHVYERHWDWLDIVPAVQDEYARGIGYFPLIERPEDYDMFVEDCERVVLGHAEPRTWFICNIVEPARRAWKAYKDGDMLGALELMDAMPSCDWRTAMNRWLERRM